jgi:hypothetical protein
MKPKKNTDDKTTVIMKKPEEETTVAMSAASKRRVTAPKASDEELKLIKSYWGSASPVLKRQAVSRYAKLMGIPVDGAEAALAEWAHLLDQSK